jgi:hypothetical protein
VGPKSARLRGQLAATVRHHGPGPKVDELARDLREARAVEYIRELVDAWPPLTAEQKSRLTLVLHGGDAP